MRFLLDFTDKYGDKWNDQDIRDYTNETLKSGKVIPGYGHAVLRETDPRFVCELEFANKNIPENDNLLKLVKANYRIIPEILTGLGKVSNPWPNVDCGSGALLMHYGFDKFDYYTVLFGVSRAFGVMSA